MDVLGTSHTADLHFRGFVNERLIFGRSRKPDPWNLIPVLGESLWNDELSTDSDVVCSAVGMIMVVISNQEMGW